MAADCVENIKPLTPEALFQLVCDEVLRDGRVDEKERETVLSIARKMRLDSGRAQEIFQASVRRFRAGLLGESRAMEPSSLCETVLAHIFADRKYEQDEEELFACLKSLFSLDDDQYALLMQKAFRRAV
ncbi:MAG: hypothetical protein HY816_09400 [Candidatus Wallbacteria bacterium]|nr:hypothetical protein [Candidatus Wallbacteria bacterium]